MSVLIASGFEEVYVRRQLFASFCSNLLLNTLVAPSKVQSETCKVALSGVSAYGTKLAI